MPTAIETSFAQFFPDKNIRPFAFLLMQRLQEGHICMKVDEEEVKTPLGIASLDRLNKVNKSMLSQNNAPAPFVFANGFLYLHRYYHYETHIIECLQQRMASAKTNEAVYKSRLDAQKDFILQALGATNPIDALSTDEKIDWQLVGVLRALMNDFSIITGGPGTGKTTTLAKLLHLLYTIDDSSKVAIAAPTGKASMRMMESLLQRAHAEKFPQVIIEKIESLKPHTLHRLLGYIHHSIHFKHHAENPLPYDWIVIDEASMIDLPMFAKLLAACNNRTRIILLGDKDQLASVEAGSLLSDLCTSAGTLNRFSQTHNHWLNDFISDKVRQIPKDYSSTTSTSLADCITELRHSRRFEEKGAIGQLSLSIIRGEIAKATELLTNNASNSEISRINHIDEDLFKIFVNGYIDFLEEGDIKKAMEKLHSIRVLATVREGKYGLYALNRKIESILHTIRPDLIKPTASFYHNRPVIITKNNYDLDLYNGDIGIVRLDEATKKLQVFFEPIKGNDQVRHFSPASLNECETVFAMTIHKSQGSEFDRVMVVLPEQTDNRLLTRELIYTGVTRAKNKAILCGSMDCLQAGISRQVVRISGIHQRVSQ